MKAIPVTTIPYENDCEEFSKAKGRFSVYTYHSPDRYSHTEENSESERPVMDVETTEILMADRVATGG